MVLREEAPWANRAMPSSGWVRRCSLSAHWPVKVDSLDRITSKLMEIWKDKICLLIVLDQLLLVMLIRVLRKHSMLLNSLWMDSFSVFSWKAGASYGHYFFFFLLTLNFSHRRDSRGVRILIIKPSIRWIFARFGTIYTITMFCDKSEVGTHYR